MKKLLLVVLGLSIFSLQADWFAENNELDCYAVCTGQGKGYCWQDGSCKCTENGKCNSPSTPFPTYLASI